MVSARACATTVAICVMMGVAMSSEPNPPVWPSTVQVFSPSDNPATIQAAVNAAYAVNGGHTPPNNGQFNSNRYAFLFQPGTYDVEVPVGYYTQVAGLGASPDDTVFTSAKGVYCEEGAYYYATGALDTFWRSAENFQTQANFKWATGTGMMWAASQASPLRRVHITNELSLYEYEPPYQAAGYSSGGYMANSKVGGTTYPGSQQQFFLRNNEFGGWSGGNWNMVFVGSTGAPNSHCSNKGGSPFTTVNTTPIIAEKPYITATGTGAAAKYNIVIPATHTGTSGTAWTETDATTIGFESVYVASNTTDTAKTINEKLDAGLHVVLSPGVYNLDSPITVNNANTVLMGLGMATLVAAAGTPVIVVGDVDGVRIAGPLLLQAGPKPTPTLLQWGSSTYPGKQDNPGYVQDVFARVGGPETYQTTTDVMFTINSGNVIIDNTWLWRADHTVNGETMNSDYPVNHGLVVNGDHVTAYGLASEHTLQDLVQWHGNFGATYFYQSELPYDVTQANFGDKGYVGYRVNSTVTSHAAYGVGVYTNFIVEDVNVASAFVCPASLVSSFVAPFTVYLNSFGGIEHVINDVGNPVSKTTNGQSYVC